MYNSNLFFLCVGLTLYTMPIGILLFWSRFYFIPDSLIISGSDIGMKRFYIVTKIILPLSKNTAISCALLSFLLAFNEYPRTYYLSGANVLVSEFLNGKLSSGADGSIYAGGSITIIITAVSILLMAIFYALFNNKGHVIKSKS
jgi:ABC-type spermidine/putrescine transport system permease subunit II